MRAEIENISDRLELTKIRGYSKNKYTNYHFINDSLGGEPDSVHRLWANVLYPSVVFSEPSSDVNKRLGRCQEIVSLQMGDLRSDIHAGNLTTDEIYQLMPFDNKFYVYRNLTYTQFSCLKDEVDKCTGAYYFRDALADVCVDLYTNEYEYEQLENISKSLSRECGAPLAGHEEVSAVTENVNTTADIFLAYAEKYMQEPRTGGFVGAESSGAFSSENLRAATTGVSIYWGVVLAVALVLFFVDARRQERKQVRAHKPEVVDYTEDVQTFI